MTTHDKIFVTSLSKAIDRARLTGRLSILLPKIYKVYADYIDWIEDRKTGGITKYNSAQVELKKRILELKYRYPQHICNYKTTVSVSGYTPNSKPYNGIQSSSSGNAPSVDGVNISLLGNSTHVFTESDFTSNYTDPNNSVADKVIIYISSTDGSFTFDNIAISGTFEFNIKDVGKLKYTRASADAFNTSFNFRVINHLGYISAITGSTLSGTSVENQPATMDDYTMTVENGVTTTLTMSMFLAGYSDPEGDLIDAIRIDEIHTTNKGTFLYSGSPVTEGQIITREDIQAELLSHTASSSDAIETDSFEFSVRDEGSGIWSN